MESDVNPGSLTSESGSLSITTGCTAEVAGTWGCRPLEPTHHILNPVLHPHRIFELEDLARRCGICPHPDHPHPQRRGRVQSTWDSMTLHFGVVNIKPTCHPTSSKPLEPPRKRLERKMHHPGGAGITVTFQKHLLGTSRMSSTASSPPRRH